MKVSLDTLLEEADLVSAPYTEQYAYINKLVEQGRVIPIQRSSLNGKHPALRTSYRREDPKQVSASEREKLTLEILQHEQIAWDFYRNNPAVFKKEQVYATKLARFLKEKRDLLMIQASVNERSFQIWQEEKYLASSGKRLLQHCGLELSALNIYATAEPIAYFSLDRTHPQTLVVVENKDPFFSMRRAMLAGQSTFFATRVSTLIYGSGKAVYRSFLDFAVSAEPYMAAKDNKFLYFGDLDFEGIGIFEGLAKSSTLHLEPFVNAYLAMLRKADGCSLPFTKSKQNRNIESLFFSYFAPETVASMQTILNASRYIPQEILSFGDYVAHALL